MSAVLGIDLGTTKSVVGIWDGGRARILTSESGSQSIPSLVMVTPDEEIYAGLRAANHPDRYNSKNITISSVKRMIGSKGETGWGWWKSYPQEVSSFILSELRQRAETLLESEANRAIIAIPSHFDEAQRRATKEAARIAGIEVERLLNEATAAVLAYGIARQSDETVAVFDLGGGTLDVSVAHIGDGVFEVKTIEGESNLGGDDFTQAIINYVTDHIRKEIGAEVADAAAHSLVLREAAERAKVDLTGSHATTLYIPGFLSRGSQYADLRVDVTRDTFETLCKPLLDRSIELLRRALQHSSAGKLDALLLLGGSSRIPRLRRLVREELNIQPFTGVDPETCVAQGAIILAGILTGCVKDVLLLDVMPSSYGVGMQGGVFKAVIKRDETVPTRRSELFTTTADNQATIGIDLFHGDGETCADNTYVGHIELDGIPPAPKALPQIEVTFDVDANMIICASAKDLGTGRERGVTICSPFGLSEVQINMMAKRLKRWEEKRRVLDALPQAHAIQSRIDQLLRQSRKLLDREEVGTLDDYSRQLSQATQKAVQAESLMAVMTVVDKAVDNIAGEVRKRQHLLRERHRLTKRIRQLDSMALGEYAPECETLSHGIGLLEEYEARGAAGHDIAALIASIRWSYCDLVSKQVVSLLRELHDSDDFKKSVRSFGDEPALAQGHSASPVAGCLACQTVRVLSSILAEDVEYADEICSRVGDIATEDQDLGAVWFLVCCACGWQHYVRYPTELPSDIGLAGCCMSTFLHMLDTETSRSGRKSVAEALTRLMPPEARFAHVVWAAMKEPDADIQTCLLGHIDRADPGALLAWFLASDADTKEAVQHSVPILRRLSQLPERGCRDFALAALVDLNSSAAWNALRGLMLHKDDRLRGATYRAIFRATDRKPQTASAIRKSLDDASLAIRLMGLENVASDPTAIDTDTVLQMVKADPSDEIRGKAVELLTQQYGEAGQLGLLSVALEEGRQEISRLAFNGVVTVRDGMDRDLTRLLALTRKLIETKKRLGIMDRLFCRSLMKRRPATRSVVCLMIDRNSWGK